MSNIKGIEREIKRLKYRNRWFCIPFTVISILSLAVCVFAGADAVSSFILMGIVWLNMLCVFLTSSLIMSLQYALQNAEAREKRRLQKISELSGKGR